MCPRRGHARTQDGHGELPVLFVQRSSAIVCPRQPPPRTPNAEIINKKLI
jgi:hypothetical protein